MQGFHVIAVALIAGLFADNQASSGVPQSVRSEWIELQRGLVGLTGRFQYKRTVTPDREDKPISDRIYEFATTDDGVLIREFGSKDDGVLVTAANAQYAFEVNRRDQNAGFELKQLRTKELTMLSMRIRDTFEPFLFAGFEICGKSMPDLVSSERFKVQSLTEDTENKKAKLVFTYARQDAKSETAMTGGIVVFATSKHWAIESFDCTTIWGRMVGTVEYQDVNGLFVPRAYDIRSYGDSDTSEVRELYEMQGISKLTGTAPVWLEDYGLSAPTLKVGRIEGSTRWLLFLANIVLVTGLLGAYYILRVRPKRANRL